MNDKPKRKQPALTAHDERRIREILLPLTKELRAIRKQLARIENRRPSVLIAPEPQERLRVKDTPRDGNYSPL